MTETRWLPYPAPKPTPPVLFVLLLLLLLGTTALRINLLEVRYFDPDELEHLQTSFLISRGWVPHKDFFENHPPLFHYLLLPLQYIQPPIKILFIARAVMQLFTLAILFFTYSLGKKFHSGAAGAVAVIGLAFNFVFLWRTLEVRPVTPALLLMVAGMSYLIDGGGDIRKQKWWPAGLLFSLAVLCTPKVGFPLLGIFICLLIYSLTRGQTDEGGKIVLAFILPLLFPLIYFSWENVLGKFIDETMLINLHWKRRFSPLIYLKPLGLFNPYLVFWAIIGLIRNSAALVGGKINWGKFVPGVLSRPGEEFKAYVSGKMPAKPVRAIILFSFVSGLGGAVLIPFPYAQYYVILLPGAAILAAGSLIDFLNWLRRPGRKEKGGKAAGGLLLLIPLGLPVYLKFGCRYSYDIPLEDFTSGLILSSLAAAGSYFLFIFSSRPLGRKLALVTLTVAILGRPLTVMLNYSSFTNQKQLRKITTIQENTGAEDRIMDGWSGLGIFRFPAYYYYYLPYDILLYLSPKQKGEDILQVLRQNQPEVVIVEGSYLSYLAPGVRAYIKYHYGPRKEESSLWWRKGKVPFPKEKTQPQPREG